MSQIDKTAPVEAILSAARRCYLAAGIEKTGMREVAAQAGVARSTLYRYFATRDEVLVAVIRQDMVSLGERLRLCLKAYPEPEHHIVEGLVLAIEEIPRLPLLNAVFASETGSRARRVIWGSPEIIELGNDFMQDVIAPALQQNRLQDQVAPEVLVEWVYRILISFLTLPSNWVKRGDQLRSCLHALLIPVVLKAPE
jgi:AcrR family transcriptional regulator